MTWLPAAAAIASTVASAVGAIQQGQAQRRLAEHRAQAAENEAAAARQKAESDERAQRQRTARRLSALRAGSAAGGVLATEGSPLLAETGAALEGELAALAIRHGGDRAEARASDAAELARRRARDAESLSLLRSIR